MDTEVRRPRSAAAAAKLPRILFGTCIVTAPLLALWQASQVAEHVGPSVVTVAWLVVSIVSGALGADLVTGLVHWACDTWGNERTRWVGPGLIRAFREHHREPRSMLDHDWIEVNGEAAAAACGGFIVLGLPPVQSALAPLPLVHAALVSLISLCALTNQLHQWAHMCDPPPIVRGLQRTSLILSPERHAAHHTTPFESAYCISTGWWNGLLDRIGFWRGLERTIAHSTGQAPRGSGAAALRCEEE